MNGICGSNSAGIGAVSGQDDATLCRNGRPAALFRPRALPSDMSGFGQAVCRIVSVGEQGFIIRREKFDGDFQGGGGDARIVAFFVGDKAVEDFGVGAEAGRGVALGEDALGAGGYGGGVEAAAHQDAGAVGAQAIGDGGVEQLAEVFDVFLRALIVNGDGGHRQRPIAARRDLVVLAGERMRGRQALNIGERGGVRLLIHVEKQEVGDGQVIQPIGDRGMLPEAIERITEDKERAQAWVEKRFDAHLVACAKQAEEPAIPDGEGKVA